jgi:hypothetical protein
MTFRLLYTLERCGMIEKVGENLYRSTLRPFKQKLYRIGYAAQGTDYTFSREVSVGVERAAATEGIELISVDNRYNPKTALRNADVLVREKVDLVIESRPTRTSPIVAANIATRTSLIALEVPHQAPRISVPTTTKPVSSAGVTSDGGPKGNGTPRSMRSCSSRSIVRAAFRKCGLPACWSG